MKLRRFILFAYNLNDQEIGLGKIKDSFKNDILAVQATTEYHAFDFVSIYDSLKKETVFDVSNIPF